MTKSSPRGWRARRRQGRSNRVLIIIENAPFPQDHRIWKETQGLLRSGFDVSVIAPSWPDQRARETVDGVQVHRYRPGPVKPGALGFVLEFGTAWIQVLWLTLKIFVRDGFAALQSANPPDIFFSVGIFYKLAGCPYIFDHHDLSPELYTARFGRDNDIVVRVLRLLERLTFLTADCVVAVNEPQRVITEARSKPKRVIVVRNGPMPAPSSPRPVVPDPRAGRRYLGVWVGAMGSVDDGLDLAIQAIASLVHDVGRTDCQFVFIGSGEVFDEVVALARTLQVEEWVTFTGWVDHEYVFDYVAGADIGLQPDPKNPRTDLATAVKTMEYMGAGVPVVAFDLDETRQTVGDAGVYATANDPASFAMMIDKLLADADQRKEMSEAGRRAVRESLSWVHQEQKYIAMYRELLGATE